MAVEHPAKVDAFVNVCCEPNDLRVGREALTDSEHAGEQQRRVDGRDFAVPTAFAGAGVEPVIEPAALLKCTRVEKAQRIAGPLNCFCAWNPVAIRGDAERSQTETGCGDARDVLMVLV